MGLLELWKKRNEIFEGIKNSVFKREDIEVVAQERLAICRTNDCGYHDPQGESALAYFPGHETCANCGCKLAWKVRALSDACPVNRWQALLTDTEDALLKHQLGISDE